ncbi:MAG: hypothetical protein V3U78_08930 [Thiotrichaceae bacterium]
MGIKANITTNKIEVAAQGRQGPPGLAGVNTWGSITGTVSDQTDLQAELDGKATSAQGTLADSATQPGDNVSDLVNDAGYLTSNAVDSVNTQTGVVVLDADDISDAATTNKYTTAAEITKLSGIEALAEVNNISDVNATDLTDAGDTALHFHSTDRARANHTGTQLASTISDFDTEVATLTGTKYISTLADLASFLNVDVYELPAGSYIFITDLDFGNTTIDMITLNGCYYFRGVCLPLIENSSTSPFFTSTTTGILFQATDFFLSSPNGTGIDLTTGNSVILDIVPFFNCKLAMDIDDFEFITLNEQPIISCEDGIIANNIGTVSIKQPQLNSGLDLGGKYITLTGASSERLLLSNIDSQPEATESFIRVDSLWGGDAVIGLGIHSTTTGGSFFDTSASGRDQTDVDINSFEIKNVTSSKSSAAVHITPGDEALTTIVLDTEVIVAGTFTEDVAQRFTTNAAGRVTYNGKETSVFNFTIKFLATPASGTNKNYDFYLRLNGTTLIDISFDTINVDSGTPGKAILIGEVELITTDFLEIIVIGRSPTPTNLTCEALAFVIA